MNRKTWVLLLCVLLLCRNFAFAQDAGLKNLIVTNSREDLLVYLNVEGAFREKMNNAILSGVPTTFSFIIDLYGVRTLWLNRKIANMKISHTIKYDNLKKEFIVGRSWKNDKPVVTRSFEEAQKLMTEIDRLEITPLSKLEKGRRYQIRAKAELSKLTLPFYLHYVLFFVSLWDFETDWYTVDFVY